MELCVVAPHVRDAVGLAIEVVNDLQHARDFTATSMDRLTALQSQLPSTARDELLAAARTLTDLDVEISSACPSCTGGITTTPDFLLSSAPLFMISS